MIPENMSPVDSSNVAQIGYDELAEELFVEFKSGSIYVYSPVPESTFEELLGSESKGGYINHEIKPNYSCRML